MPKRKKIIQNKKLRGEWAEMQFMARAAEHGLSVSKPWGEMRPFDFVVGNPRHFASVQVKSTIMQFKTGYVCTVRGGHKAYPAGSFDFVAAYAVPEDSWYIIPAALIRGKRSITLFPNSKKALYEPYREAWHLLREAAGGAEEVMEESAREEVSVQDSFLGSDSPNHDSRNDDSQRDDSQNEDRGAEQAAREGSPKRPPATALERMQASAKFFRDFLARNGTSGPKR